MKNFFGKLGEKIGSARSPIKTSDIDFGGKMEKISDDAFVFESYGQQTKIQKYDEELFSIGGIIESEKNIQLVADFMNRGKNLAAEGYRNSIEHVTCVSFSYDPDFPENNVSIVFDIENDIDPEERGDEYEAGYGTSKSIIDAKLFKKMNEQERYIIRKNAATVAKYLDERTKEVKIAPSPIAKDFA